MTVTTRRTLTAPAAGPVVLDLDMPHGQIDVRVCTIERAEVELSTAAPAESPTGKAIADATLTTEVRALTVRVPTPDGATTIISNAQGGRVVVSGGVNSGIIVSGGSITITGGSISGGQIISGGHVISGATVNPGVPAVLRLPYGSALKVRTTTGTVTTNGELEWTQFTSMSGDLHADACRRLTAASTSGNVYVEYADHAEVRTVSGNISLGRTETVTAHSTSGNVTIGDFGGAARLSTVSGDIAVSATEPGHISATSTSGDIRVSAPAELAAAGGAHGLTVDARSLTGDVRTPRPPAGPARPRRPRHR